MFSDAHLHLPYALSDHAEREAIAQRHLATRVQQPVMPLLALPMALCLVVRVAFWHPGPRAQGASPAPLPAARQT